MVVNNASEDPVGPRQQEACLAGQRMSEWWAGRNSNGEDGDDRFWLLDRLFEMHGGPDNN
jgi:hypothetical protein